jgi:hypothetical protein
MRSLFGTEIDYGILALRGRSSLGVDEPDDVGPQGVGVPLLAQAAAKELPFGCAYLAELDTPSVEPFLTT